MTNFSEEDCKFLKEHSKELESIFNKRLEQLKESVFDVSLDPQRREIEIRFIQEIKVWFRTLYKLKEERIKKGTNEYR